MDRVARQFMLWVLTPALLLLGIWAIRVELRIQELQRDVATLRQLLVGGPWPVRLEE